MKKAKRIKRLEEQVAELKGQFGYRSEQTQRLIQEMQDDLDKVKAGLDELITHRKTQAALQLAKNIQDAQTKVDADPNAKLRDDLE